MHSSCNSLFSEALHAFLSVRQPVRSATHYQVSGIPDRRTFSAVGRYLSGLPDNDRVTGLSLES
jgi:hypothetical protein